MTSEEIDTMVRQTVGRAGRVTTAEVADRARISRQAAQAHLARLVREGLLLRVGQTRGAYYVPFSSSAARKLARRHPTHEMRVALEGLEEDRVFDRILARPRLVESANSAAGEIFRYAFTEILNNAIEHSGSSHARIHVEGDGTIRFRIADQGVGIFRHLRDRLGLSDEQEAIQELLKGKRTTLPDRHSGEGIFFTSKIADRMEIRSAKLQLGFDNRAGDVFVGDVRSRRGTRVDFEISSRTRKSLDKLFGEFTDTDYAFSKTHVTVTLYRGEAGHVSRSEARRLLHGLEPFREIVLDFRGVRSIGQAFADEVFRVYMRRRADVTIRTVNTSPAVDFMIRRARGDGR